MNVEAYLEKKFVKWCKDNGCIAIKGPSSTAKGFPDRFVPLVNGGIVYVEFKGSSYYDLTPMQVWWKDYLLSTDSNRYFVVDTEDKLDKLIKYCEAFMQIGHLISAFEKDLLSGILDIKE